MEKKKKNNENKQFVYNHIRILRQMWESSKSSRVQHQGPSCSISPTHRHKHSLSGICPAGSKELNIYLLRTPSWQIKSWISVQHFKSLEQKALSKHCINSLFVFEKGNRWTKSWKKKEKQDVILCCKIPFPLPEVTNTLCLVLLYNKDKGNCFARIFWYV